MVVGIKRTVFFAPAGLLELDQRHTMEGFFVSTLAFKTAEVEPYTVPLASQLVVHGVLPLRPRHVNRVGEVEPAHLFTQVALVIDRPGRAEKMGVEGARIAAVLPARLLQTEPLGGAEGSA